MVQFLPPILSLQNPRMKPKNLEKNLEGIAAILPGTLLSLSIPWTFALLSAPWTVEFSFHALLTSYLSSLYSALLDVNT